MKQENYDRYLATLKEELVPAFGCTEPVAIDSGMVCDGAKASCAAKIASAVDSGIFGYVMYKNGQEFLDGDGIVVKGVENTIRNIGRLGRDGMRGTNDEIIRMMTGE